MDIAPVRAATRHPLPIFKVKEVGAWWQSEPEQCLYSMFVCGNQLDNECNFTSILSLHASVFFVPLEMTGSIHVCSLLARIHILYNRLYIVKQTAFFPNEQKYVALLS